MKSILKYIFLLALSLILSAGTDPLAAQTSQAQVRKENVRTEKTAQQKRTVPQQNNPKRSATVNPPSRTMQQQTAQKRSVQHQTAPQRQAVPYPQRQTTQRQKYSKTRAAQIAAKHIRERRSENPVRFAFSPKPQKESQYRTADKSWDDQPSPMAILSTLVTMQIAPELVAWHLDQRKKAEYERELAAQGKLPPNEQHHSEYGDMLGRMQFSLSDHSRSRETDIRQSGTYEDPSSGAILAQFLTGQKNGEMRDWKENQTLLASADPEEVFNPGDFIDPEEILNSEELYQYIPPIPDPLEILTAQVPFYDDPNLPRRAAENAPVPIRNLNGIRNAAVTGDTPVRSPVMIANAEENRFIDDHFPTGQAASADYHGIRQVSAEIRTPVSQAIPVLQRDEPVSRSGQIRVYSEADENGWSPIE